jgi:hypothetical protein
MILEIVITIVARCSAAYPDHTRDSILTTFGTSFLPVTLIYGPSLAVRQALAT